MADMPSPSAPAEIDECPQGCLNRLAPTCVIHRPSAEKDAPCGCQVGGLHRYACGLVGHVDPPRNAEKDAGLLRIRRAGSIDDARRLMDEELARAWDAGRLSGLLGDAARTKDNPYRPIPPVACDHPGIEHGPLSHTGTCPRCRKCKFIGHGPLCLDCHALPAGGPDA